ncbi:hypothetical protein QGN32_01010 [Mycolicibacterium sp. ND9-15]|nr:hypothetical protein [Mycolicibacterium sp. ND9-15]WSE56556.1 hypothetical protein QGN32_01010 [Mycolicibacterium sp. ND9-15]
MAWLDSSVAPLAELFRWPKNRAQPFANADRAGLSAESRIEME